MYRIIFIWWREIKLYLTGVKYLDKRQKRCNTETLNPRQVCKTKTVIWQSKQEVSALRNQARPVCKQNIHHDAPHFLKSSQNVCLMRFKVSWFFWHCSSTLFLSFLSPNPQNDAADRTSLDDPRSISFPFALKTRPGRNASAYGLRRRVHTNTL